MAAFEEINNHLFWSISTILLNMKNGEEYTNDQLKEAMRSGFNYESAFYPDDEMIEQEIIKNLFIPDEETKTMRPREDVCFDIIPSRDELDFLSGFIDSREADFLIPDKLRKKIAECLGDRDVSAFSPTWLLDRGNLSDKVIAILRAYYQALTGKHRIEAACDSGEHLTICPCRVEYDFANGRYTLLAWEETVERIVRIPIGIMEEINIIPDQIPDDIEEKFEKYLSDHKREVTMQITNERNAVERCFRIFAASDRDAWVDKDRKVYELTVTYYDFDEEDTIKRIMSLGSMAKVIAPESIREKIIERFRQALEYYSNERA